MLQDILVHVDGAETGRRRVDYANNVARRHGARLTGIHVTPPVDVPPYYKPSAIGRAAAAIERHQMLDAAAAEATFKAVTSDDQTLTIWRSVHGHMASEICDSARCADLIIVGQYEHEGAPEHHPLTLADDVVVASGVPVLVVPEAASSEGKIRRALIAWDGSRATVRSVHDALPLLLKAGANAEIVVVDGNDRPGELAPLIEHLARHGLVIDGQTRLPASPSQGGALVDQLELGRFDLLVMGAYGHPAWFEFIFGGTTRSILLNATTPVLISH